MKKIWFTADTHFYHYNIIKYENRPFGSVEEMNETIINNWNELVDPEEDTVYHLGDISLGSNKKTDEILWRLNGNIRLIQGNHDKLSSVLKERFDWIKDYYKLKVQGHKIILCHYPIYSWDSKHHGSIHLHGHTHTDSHSDFSHPNKINVGMDCWNFKPVELSEILYRVFRDNSPDMDELGS